MKIKNLILSALFSVSCAFPIHAEIVFSDSFDYPVGSILGTDPDGAWGATNTVVTDSGVSLRPGSIDGDTYTSASRYLWPALTSGTYYFGFSAMNSNGGDTWAGISLEVEDASQGVWVQQLAGSKNWQLTFADVIVTDSVSTAFATTVLTNFVLKITFTGTNDEAVADLFINPSSLLEPLTADASVTGRLSEINYLIMASTSATDSDVSTYLDVGGIICATTYAEAVTVFVIPEPATYAIIGGMIFLVFTLIRRAKAHLDDKQSG